MRCHSHAASGAAATTPTGLGRFKVAFFKAPIFQSDFRTYLPPAFGEANGLSKLAITASHTRLGFTPLDS